VYHHGSGQSWYLPLGLGLAILLVWPVISMYQSQAWRDRGVADQDNHSYDLAAADFNQAHSGLVYDPDVLTAEGINYDKLGTLRIDLTSNATKALSDARQAIKLDSSDSQHYFLQARAQVLAGHYDQAIQSYLAAISHDEWNHPVYYNDLIQVDIAYRQKWVDAARMVSTVIDLYPNDVISNRSADTTLEPTIAQSYALRADIWLHDNRPDQAKLDIGRALKLDKTNSLALQLQSQL
jgi:tetratricopeptide (TPR) repeat protein